MSMTDFKMQITSKCLSMFLFSVAENSYALYEVMKSSLILNCFVWPTIPRPVEKCICVIMFCMIGATASVPACMRCLQRTVSITRNIMFDDRDKASPPLQLLKKHCHWNISVLTQCPSLSLYMYLYYSPDVICLARTPNIFLSAITILPFAILAFLLSISLSPMLLVPRRTQLSCLPIRVFVYKHRISVSSLFGFPTVFSLTELLISWSW